MTFDGLAQRAQRFDGGRELHAVVGGRGLGAGEVLALVAGNQQRAPAAGPRVAPAGAVRVDLDVGHGRLRVVGSGSAPNTRRRSRKKRCRSGVMR